MTDKRERRRFKAKIELLFDVDPVNFDHIEEAALEKIEGNDFSTPSDKQDEISYIKSGAVGALQVYLEPSDLEDESGYFEIDSTSLIIEEVEPETELT